MSAGQHERQRDVERQQEQQHSDVLERPDEALVVPELTEVGETDVVAVCGSPSPVNENRAPRMSG